MAYSAQTFVAGEQPTTAKWNILWSNDASFNDGTGIASAAITSAKISGFDYSLATTISLPYKYGAYRNAAYTTANGITTKFPYDAERFDTNNNYDSTTNFRYTAPVTGFYQFNGGLLTASTTRLNIAVYTNGSEFVRGNDVNASTFAVNMAAFVSLTATDYVEFFYFAGSAVAVTGGLTQSSGYLVSRT